MSEIKECSIGGGVSIDNAIDNNETDQLKTITPLEEVKSEIDKEIVKVQDVVKTSEDLKMENENTVLENSNLPKCDLALKSIPDTDVTGSSKVEEIPTMLPVMEDCLSPMVNKDETVLMCKLEEEIKERTNERDMYQKKLAETEKKLADLEVSVATAIKSADNNEINAHVALEELKNKLTQTTMQLQDRGIIVANQEKQINALNVQVSTLKEVVAITRDLLQIRNTEVKHLQAEVDSMEARIAEEREKHNTIITRMDDAVRLNSDLKKEYETQLHLFKDLRIKYDEKITLLSEEKRALELANQSTTN